MAEELKEAFKVFDRDQDGYISATEVKTISKRSLKRSFSLFILM